MHGVVEKLVRLVKDNMLKVIVIMRSLQVLFQSMSTVSFGLGQDLSGNLLAAGGLNP